MKITALKDPKIYLWLGVTFGLLLNGAVVWNNYAQNHPILGLSVNHHSIWRLSRPDLVRFINQLAGGTKPLQIIIDGETISINPKDLNASVDAESVTRRLLQVGRTGPLLSRLRTQLETLVGLNNQRLKGHISQTSLSLKLLELQDRFNRDALPLRPNFTGDLKQTLPPEDGRKINTDAFTVLVSDRLFDPPSQPTTIETIKTFTTHNEAELAPIRLLAQKMLSHPISIISGGKKLTLSGTDIASLLVLLERSDPGNPNKLVLKLRLDEKKLNHYLDDFAQKVTSTTEGEFNDHEARVALYRQLYNQNIAPIVIPITSFPKKPVVLGASSDKVVYLTFDDGPNQIYHPMILDILKQYGVKATFFLIGNNVNSATEMTKRTFADGHTLGDHTMSHPFLPSLSRPQIDKEIGNDKALLKGFNNSQDIRLFRPPYGGVNLSVKESSDNNKLILYLWDVDPRDWTEPPVDELVRRVTGALHPGANILLHSNHSITARALPKIIEFIQKQGYSFETLR